MNKQNYVHTIFSSISKRYDFLNSLLSLTLDKSWREFAVSVSDLKPGCRVLDVCTGTGELALAYAKALFYPPPTPPKLKGGQNSQKRSIWMPQFIEEPRPEQAEGCEERSNQTSCFSTNSSNCPPLNPPKKGDYKTRVIGTDFCHEMLVICKQKLGIKKVENALVPIEADTLFLPFKDNSFDVASAAFGIRNVTDIRRGIREMARVIVPGGRVVILEFTQPTNPIFRGIYYLYFTKILPLMGNIISQNRHDAYGYLPNSVMTFPDKNQLKEIMEECGLMDVKVYLKIFGIVAIHVGRK